MPQKITLPNSEHRVKAAQIISGCIFQAHLIWNLCQSTSMRYFSTVMNLWRNTHRIAIIEGEKSKTAFASCVP